MRAKPWPAMPDGKWFDYAAQSMIHALVAALAIEALLRLWRARAPDDRLALRLLGLGQPLIVTPALFLAAPQRGGEDFHDRWAIFSARNWEEVRFLGVSAFHAGVILMASIGAALFLMDLVPLLRGRRRALPPESPAPAELVALLAEIASAQRVSPPSLHFIEARAPVLFCSGVRATELVVSRGALGLLDARELRAALAHELAHLLRRDPALSWALMGVRAVLFFNPVAQVVARALARDAEWRADEEAGADRLDLASAVLKLHRAGVGRRAPTARTLPFAAALGEPLRRARSHDVEARCRRLLEPSPPTPVTLRVLRLALTTASLIALAAFVA
jgi:Zn-dependent protease with chaperone function